MMMIMMMMMMMILPSESSFLYRLCFVLQFHAVIRVAFPLSRLSFPSLRTRNELFTIVSTLIYSFFSVFCAESCAVSTAKLSHFWCFCFLSSGQSESNKFKFCPRSVCVRVRVCMFLQILTIHAEYFPCTALRGLSLQNGHRLFSVR